MQRLDVSGVVRHTHTHTYIYIYIYIYIYVVKQQSVNLLVFIARQSVLCAVQPKS
jgi:hypothetical protein